MKTLPQFLLCIGVTALLAATGFGEGTAELLTEGQTAYLRGDMDAAKRAFTLVNQLDSHNTTAINYLRLIKANAGQNGAPGKAQEKRLAAVIIPQVQFREATLGSALDYLKQQVAKVTDGKVGLSFVVQIPDETVKTTSVTLSLANVPVTEVLRYLGGLANVTFSYEPYAIVVKSKTAPVAVTAAKEAAPAQ